MVKPGSRSKSGKGRGRSGSGSSPSSPTRRLKKGGKRGRRLCQEDGCTLCPSFGFEGEVAVSCSHHKAPGMRNLTARRCQHEGCFTVANFGMPGDKPGFCAAHSTGGMVNRNKPRGAEGGLAGVPIARSSRRAAKANSTLQDSTNGSASELSTRSSTRRGSSASSASDGSISHPSSVAGAEEHSADDCKASPSSLNTRARMSGRPRVSYKEDTDDELDDHDGADHIQGTSEVRVGGIQAEDDPMTGINEFDSLAPSFEADNSRYDVKAMIGVDGAKGRGGGVTAAVLAPDLQFLRKAGIMNHETLAPGICATTGTLREFPENVGTPWGGAKVVRAGVTSTGGMEVNFTAELDTPKDAGNLLMDGVGLDYEVPLTLDMSGGLDDFLKDNGDGVDDIRNSANLLGQDTMHVIEPGVRPHHVDCSATPSHDSVEQQDESSSSESADTSVALGREGLSLTGYTELDVDDFNVIGKGHNGGSTASVTDSTHRGSQAAAPSSSASSSLCAAQHGSISVRLGLVTAGNVASRALFGSNGPHASGSSGGLPISASHPAGPAVGISSSAETSVAASAPSSGGGTLPTEEPWWDVFAGEEYVAMPEPIWSDNLNVPALEEDATANGNVACSAPLAKTEAQNAVPLQDGVDTKPATEASCQPSGSIIDVTIAHRDISLKRTSSGGNPADASGASGPGPSSGPEVARERGFDAGFSPAKKKQRLARTETGTHVEEALTGPRAAKVHFPIEISASAPAVSSLEGQMAFRGIVNQHPLTATPPSISTTYRATGGVLGQGSSLGITWAGETNTPPKSSHPGITHQSTSPWATASLCPPPQQTQAAGRA